MPEPIETRYKGYRFRSRLEARWAVFFDALAIPWDYELEGFYCDGGMYLPDFYLPSIGCYAEVKPAQFAEAEFRRAMQLDGGCLLLEGVPGKEWYHYVCRDYEELMMSCCGEMPPYKHYALLRCEWFSVHPLISHQKKRPWFAMQDQADSYGIHEYEKAIVCARSARFEHGQSPFRS